MRRMSMVMRTPVGELHLEQETLPRGYVTTLSDPRNGVVHDIVDDDATQARKSLRALCVLAVEELLTRLPELPVLPEVPGYMVLIEGLDIGEQP